MHLWDQRGANRLVFVTSLVFVALLIGLTVADYATRFPLANPPGSEVLCPRPITTRRRRRGRTEVTGPLSRRAGWPEPALDTPGSGADSGSVLDSRTWRRHAQTRAASSTRTYTSRSLAEKQQKVARSGSAASPSAAATSATAMRVARSSGNP